MTYTDKEKAILRHIGFFCYKEHGNNIERARDFLSLLYITKVKYETVSPIAFESGKPKNVDKVVTIELGRPGLLIGKHGSTIESLKKYLTAKLNEEIKINIVENCLLGYLQCFELANESVSFNDFED